MATLTNLATNPNPHVSDVNWFAGGTSSTRTFTRSGSGFAGSADGYMLLTFTTVTGASDGHVEYDQPVTAGDLFSASIQVIPSRDQVFTPLVAFLDGSGLVLQTTYGTDVSVAAGVVAVLGVGGLTVPADAVTAQIVAATSLDNGSAWQVGDTVEASRVIVSASLSVPDYFDGSYPNAAWSGTAYASTSSMAAVTAPTLTPLPDWSPVPRVSVIFTGLHPLAQRITVERLVGNKSFRVRGAINRFAVGGFGVQDFEAPFQVQSTYRAEQFDGNGLSLGYTDSASTTLDVNVACLHQPLDPTRNVKYSYRDGAAGDIVKPFSGSMYYPEGRGEGVWVGSQRQGITALNLNGATDALEDADKLDSMFGSVDEPQTPILCIRTVGMDLPPTLFAVVQEPHQIGLNRSVGGTTIYWDMTGTQVAPPAPGLIVPLLTYDDLDASYATYDDRDAHYGSYFEQDTDWALAGAAG